MELAFAFLADEAMLDQGCFTVPHGGGRDRLPVAAFPYRHPKLVLVYRLRLNEDERTRDHSLRVDLVDPNGTLVRSSDAPTEPSPNDGVLTGTIALMGVEFAQPGQYTVAILLDGQRLARLPLGLMNGSDVATEPGAARNTSTPESEAAGLPTSPTDRPDAAPGG